MSESDKAAFTSESLMEGSLPFHLLQNILTYYLDLPCFLIKAQEWTDWHTVVTLRQKKNSPMDFESAAQWKARIRYNERSLRKAAAEGRPQCTEYLGLHGLFAPVMRQGRCLGILQSGVFLRELPDEEGLLRLWKRLRGRAPGPYEEAFLEYVRAIVDTPVLDAELVRALGEVLTLFGAFLSQSLGGREIVSGMAGLQKGVIAKRLWHRQWVEWQAIQPKFFRFSGDSRTLMRWETEELGITRFPTTVLAAKREGTGKEWTDWLAARAFQRESLLAAKGLEETLGYPLENYGVLLLTSAKPGRPARAAEAEIRARAEEFSGALARRLQCGIWVGIGGRDSGTPHLQESYHEAVLALHLAVARDQRIVQYADQPSESAGETGLRRKIEALTRSLFEQGKVPASHHRGVFVQEVLIGTRGRPEATRRIFMETLHRLVTALESGKNIGEAELADLESGIALRLETAVNVNEMVGRFETALELLLSFMESPASGDKYLRLRRASEAIASSLQEPWTLPVAARRFGFSVTTFSREFGRHAGMPFSDFLLSRRLEKAKTLLQGDLSLAQVAEACGFSSLNYFLQVFKRKVGVPPGRFRLRQKGQNDLSNKFYA